MKALILGGGFAGCTTAYLLQRAGWDVTLVEKEPHLGGGCRTFFHAGHPFTYGPRLYYGYSAKVFEWVNSFVPLRRFPFELRTLAHEPIDEQRQFWSFPPHQDDVPLYPRSLLIRKELAGRDNSTQPQDFDEYYRQKVGPTIYEMFTDFYSRKMWMIDSNKLFDLFSWSAKDEPLASGTRDAYKGSFIGYPVPPDGYNSYFDRMVVGTDVQLGREWKHGDATDADVVISTLPIDEFCNYVLGELPYVGRDFHLLVLPCAQVFPGDVRFCHYAGKNDEWTRVTEFKKLSYHQSESTLLVLEKPSKNGKLYPYQTKANVTLAAQYLATLPDNVYSIGRLGVYKYATIEQVIVMAFQCATKITGKPNQMEGQFFEIGDKTLIPKDRKAAA